MQHALYVPNFGAFGDPLRVAEWAELAERAGWDGLFLWDHVARPVDLDVCDPWIALAAAAMRTRNLRLGALVTPLARRRPWKFARETASLDRLSEGRLVVGVGLGSQGGHGAEWEAFGEELDLRRRAAMLDEALELVVRLWSGRAVEFDGNHYHASSAPFRPTPVQEPLPIWVAGTWPRKAPMRRAARFQGAFPLLAPELDEAQAAAALTECAAFLARECGDWNAFDLVHLAPPTLAGDRARLVPFSEAGVTWWLERMTPDEFGGEWSEPWPLEAMAAHVQRGPLRGC